MSRCYLTINVSYEDHVRVQDAKNHVRRALTEPIRHPGHPLWPNGMRVLSMKPLEPRKKPGRREL